MPLTFPAHPLMVVPLKKYLPFPLDGLALFVGAMSPDFSYIFILDRDIFHEGWQAFALGLPLALLFYGWIGSIMVPVWRTVFASVAWINVQKIVNTPRSSFFWVLVSLLLGIGSHILLDGMTHHDFWPGSLYMTPENQKAVWWGTTAVFSPLMWIIAYKYWPHTKMLSIRNLRYLLTMVGVQIALSSFWYTVMEVVLKAPIHGRIPRSFSMGVIGAFSVIWMLLAWRKPKDGLKNVS